MSKGNERVRHAWVEQRTNLTRSGIMAARLTGGFPPPFQENGTLEWDPQDIEKYMGGCRTWPPVEKRLRGPGWRREPDYPTFREAQVAQRNVGRIGCMSNIVAVGTGTAHVLVVLPEGGKSPAEQARDLAILLPRMRFQYIDSTGKPADVNTASVNGSAVAAAAENDSVESADFLG